MDTKDKQGHVGSLCEKSVLQLQELLDREKNILKNVKFIENLPDKGQKIKRFAKQIETELQSRMDVDSTADMITKMSLQSTDGNIQDENVEQDTLRNIVHKPPEKTVVIEKDEEVNDSRPFTNSYEKVIQQTDRKLSPNKFYPHKTLKSETKIPSLDMEVSKDVVSLDELPPLESPSSSRTGIEQAETDTKDCVHSDTPNQVQTSPAKTVNQTSNSKHKYDESLEASNFRPTKFEKAKIISIEESAQLIQAQRLEQEKLQAQHAAKRLAERMGVKLCDYEPKEVQMRYRSPTAVLSESGESSDSENEEVDYPD